MTRPNRRDQKEVVFSAVVGLALAVCCGSPRPDVTMKLRSPRTSESTSTQVSVFPPVTHAPASVAQLITDTTIVERRGVEGDFEFLYNAKGVLVATREGGGPISYEVSRPYTVASARRDK